MKNKANAKNKTKKYNLIHPLTALVVVAVLLWYFQPWAYLSSEAENGENNPSVNGDCSLKVSFIDVGQGMATLLEHEGEFALIDTGDTQGRDELLNYLAAEGVTSLTYLLGSHPHSDHIANIPAVLSTYPVDTVILNVYDYDSRTWDKALESLATAGLSATPAMSGDEFTLGDVAIEVLSPWQPVTEYSETNDTSIVVQVSHGTDDFLICGDATVYVENELIYRYGEELQSEVYNVAHHGSYLSNSPQFLAAIEPEIYVISVGANNQYKHPDAETLDRINQQGGTLYRTDQDGTVVITSDAQGLRVVQP